MISLNLSKDEYFIWLLNKIGAEKSYMSLCGQLYKIKFTWFVPNDDNRIQDGFDLRDEYLDEFDAELETDMLFSDCSVLELIIGVCNRISYESNLSVDDAFWELITNLKLEKYADNYYNENAYRQINKKIKTFIDRTYSSNGEGGLFPLKFNNEDQRKVEIWYQMSAYLIENDLT